MLDTNILSALMSDPAGAAGRRVAGQSADSICTSIIVGGELRYGAAKRQSARLSAAVEMILERFVVLPLDAPADRSYGETRADLERRGQIIGHNDMLIAAHALALDCTLVTANTSEFGRVAGLRIENWL